MNLVKIKNIRKIESNSLRYDIQTRRNHNFFANGILVHNSCGLIFYANNEWNIVTRGSFNSEQCQWAKQWVNANVNTDLLNKDFTYIAEIIYKENRIVVPYDYEGLVLITVYDRTSGREISYDELVDISTVLNVRVVKKFFYKDLNEVLDVCKTLDHTSEGFVVQFANGLRIKIKGDEYMRVHRLVSRVTPLGVWEMMLKGDNMDLMLVALPEELRRDFQVIQKILFDKINVIIQKIESFYNSTLNLSDKELGLKISDLGEYLSPIEKNFVFPCRKNDFLNQWKIGDSRQRKYLFDLIRPNGNKLNGYIPSNAMNRFAEME